LKNQLKNESTHNIINNDMSESIKAKILISNQTNQIEPLNIKKRVHSFENRLAQIGKLERKIEMPIPNRSSTPDEKTSPTNLFKINK
jgi:hypothetical protein